MLVFWKSIQTEPSFSFWYCAYFPVLGSLKLHLLCHQTPAITSLYPYLQLDDKILLFFPGIPSSFRARCTSVLCNELFSYLAPRHCFSWLCALFTTCLFCSEDKAINLLVVFYFTVCMLLRHILYLFSLHPWSVRGMIIIQTL